MRSVISQSVLVAWMHAARERLFGQSRLPKRLLPRRLFPKRLLQSLDQFQARFLKYLEYNWRRILRVRATPHEIALGCAAGVFAACTPFLGFQMAMAFALAVLLRVSVPAALAATFVGNPLSWPAIWGASYIAGSWLLGNNPAAAADTLAQSATAIRATLHTTHPVELGATMVNLSPLWTPMVLGGILIGLLAAAGSYYPMRRAVKVFQNRHSS